MWRFIKDWWFIPLLIAWGVIVFKAPSDSPLRTLIAIAVLVIFGIWLIQHIVKRKRSRP